jgi:hypothetical protein
MWYFGLFAGKVIGSVAANGKHFLFAEASALLSKLAWRVFP